MRRGPFGRRGLPEWFLHLIGALKIGSAVALLAGLWYPQLVLPAAGLLVALMVGALAMHVKVSDAVGKAVPAGLMLAMSVTLMALVS